MHDSDFIKKLTIADASTDANIIAYTFLFFSKTHGISSYLVSLSNNL